MHNPKEQLELLTVYQQKFERLLQARTGLTVRVSLAVHSTSNSPADLLHLFEASLTLPDFEQASTSRRTWITHTDLRTNVAVFMPEGFDADELHPDSEDLEGYRSAVENANARQMLSPEGRAIEAASRRAEEQLKRNNDDEIPF